MTYEISIADVEPRQLAAIREPLPWATFMTRFMALIEELWAYIRANDIKPTGHNVVVYDGDGLLEIAVETTVELPDNPRVTASMTPGGRAATAVHWGDYSKLTEAHTAVRDWCRANGQTLAGRSWEVYGDWDDDPAKVRTDVFHLLA